MLTDLPLDTEPARTKTSPLAKASILSAPSLAQVPRPDVNGSIQRVSFVLAPPSSAKVLLKFADPEHRVAIVDASPTDVWPDAPAPKPGEARPERDGPDFDCISIDVSSAAPETLARLEKWIDPEGTNEATASVRVKIIGGWVRVKPGRAVICAPKAEWEGLLAALADFCF